MSSANRRMDKTNEAAPLGRASVRKKALTSTPHSMLVPLIPLGLVHETRVVAQLDVAAIPLDGAVRVADAHDVSAAGVLAQEAVLEAEAADEVHLFLDLGATRVIA